MYKDATYKQKFADLNEWIPVIVESIKKDLKNDHLKKDLFFVKKFLNTKNIQKLTSEELAEAYAKAIQEEEKGEDIAEFIVSRWLLKNSELYTLFEQHLNKITTDFTALEEIKTEQAQSMVDASINQFGAVPTYLFAVLNSVVFSKETFDYLNEQAKLSHQKTIEEAITEQDRKHVETVSHAYEREMARLTDKYEKKLAGMQKKYQIDTEHLKKQVAILQRKLQDK
jgi:hypothetical protein